MQNRHIILRQSRSTQHSRAQKQTSRGRPKSATIFLDLDFKQGAHYRLIDWFGCHLRQAGRSQVSNSTAATHRVLELLIMHGLVVWNQTDLSTLARLGHAVVRCGDRLLFVG